MGKLINSLRDVGKDAPPSVRFVSSLEAAKKDVPRIGDLYGVGSFTSFTLHVWNGFSFVALQPTSGETQEVTLTAEYAPTITAEDLEYLDSQTTIKGLKAAVVEVLGKFAQ